MSAAVKAAPAAKAEAKPSAEKGGARKGGLGFKLAMVGLGIAALAMAPLSLVALPGMMPSIAIAIIDRRRTPHLGFSVAMMNFAGVFPILITVAKSSMTLEFAAQKLSDPFTWIVMYGAAAIGYLATFLTPPIARFCIEIQAGQRRRTLEAMAKAMRTEWGEEVTRGKR